MGKRGRKVGSVGAWHHFERFGEDPLVRIRENRTVCFKCAVNPPLSGLKVCGSCVDPAILEQRAASG